MTDVLAYLVLIVGVPLNLYVFLKLRTLSACNPEIKVLRERAIVAGIILLIVVVFGLIFVNNDLEEPLVAWVDTKLVTRLALLALAIIPASYWLRIYR